MTNEVQSLRTSLQNQQANLQDQQRRLAADMSSNASVDHSHLALACDKLRRNQMALLDKELQTIAEQVRLVDEIADWIQTNEDIIKGLQENCSTLESINTTLREKLQQAENRIRPERTVSFSTMCRDNRITGTVK